MSNDNNSLPELLELLVRINHSNAKVRVTNIHADLRIAKAEMECPDGHCFVVGLKRAWLSLDVAGLNPMPGSRFGEPVRTNEESTKRKLVTETTVEDQTNADAAVRVSANPSLNVGGKRAAKEKSKTSVSSTETSTHTRVKARANLKWEVTESANLDHLDGTYLSDDVLCRASQVVGANIRSVQLEAYARQKDIAFEILKEGKRSFLWPSNNHEKMLKVFVAKTISGSSADYSGQILLSRSEVLIED